MSDAVSYQVRHETIYEYSRDVVHSHQLLHLAPRQAAHQTCSANEIRIDPEPVSRSNGQDAFGNPVTRLEFDRPHRCLTVTAEMTVKVRARPAPAKGESWERARSQLAYTGRPPGAARLEALRYRSESPHVRIKQMFTDYAADCFPAGRPLVDCADSLMHKLYEEMTYAPGETTITTPLLEVMEKRRGVCQDFAHLMIACLRSRGLAARYVSGYLRTIPVPTTAPAASSLAESATASSDPLAGSTLGSSAAPLLGADASHAWVAVYCPTAGWVDFDPTNGVRAGTDHITLAWGRDFGDVSPLRGVIVGGGRHHVTVRVDVRAG